MKIKPSKWVTTSSENCTEKFLNWIRKVFKLKYKKLKNWDQEDLKLQEEANKIR